MISVGTKPAALALTPDETELYVADSGDDAVHVVQTARNQVTGRIPLGCAPEAIAILADGSAALVGCNTGVCVISLRTRAVTRISTRPARDLAVAHDSKIAYLAEQTAGLWKLDIVSRQLFQIDPLPRAMNLALTPDGKYLYVNYQQSGPGGRPGHDAIGKFDAKTGRFLHAITGLANVGDALALSPDGLRLWADGEDACASPAYDHLGCPAVPAGVVNIIDTAADRLVRSVPLVSRAFPGFVKFSPDGRFVVVNGGGPRFIDAGTFATLAALPDLTMNALVLLHDGRRAYVALKENRVAVLDIERR
jgi:YVTN family beta-propeller protein